MELCEEMKKPGDEGTCGKLNMSMYGTKAAAQNWQREVQRTMGDMGFEMGRSSSVVFKHGGRKIKTMVHGDDFISSGKEKDLLWMRGELEKRFKISTKVLGERPGMVSEVKVLKRILTWVPGKGIAYEANPKHVKEMISGTGVGDMKPLAAPVVKEGKQETEEEKEEDITRRRKEGRLGEKYWEKDSEKMGPSEATQYRQLAARANYLGQDRPDVCYGATQLTRKMSAPEVGDRKRLQRRGRYLKGHPYMRLWYPYQGPVGGTQCVHRQRPGRMHTDKEIDKWGICVQGKTCDNILE